MSASLLDGRALAAKIEASLAARSQALRASLRRAPKLVFLAAESDAAARSYLRSQEEACRRSGIETAARVLPATLRESKRCLEDLGRDPAVNALLLAQPLPEGLPAEALLAALPPDKDAEGLCPLHYGRLFEAKSYAELQSSRLVVPCTALAVAELLRESRVPLSGKRAVVLGRSAILGRPAAHLLSMLDLTVTLCHSRTRDLEDEVRRADVVVAAMGRPRFVQSSWLKKGCVVIDAGIHAEGGKIMGDVDFEPARAVASHITPVPGGVGPVTAALLAANVLTLAEARQG